MQPLINLEYIRQNNLIVYETVSGSHAYGLNTPTSDLDLRGVFILPNELLLGGRYVEQVADEKNDIIYYEIGRFLNLLAKNNPGMLELLYTPADCVRLQHPVMANIMANRKAFLTKRCEVTFGGYATQQIQKARGLNKKIVNPVEPNRKTPLDFCYILEPFDLQTVPAVGWLEKKGFRHEACGLVNLTHASEVYALFHDPNAQIYQPEGTFHPEELHFRGIAFEQSNDLRLSSVPKGQTPFAYLFYNKDGYSVYCKTYQAYWDWVENRNDARYQQNQEHGKGYDSKNMMHCMRLLEMAHEIAETGEVVVRRPNREELLWIRKGEADYDELLARATKLMESLTSAYAASNLPAEVPDELIYQLTLEARLDFNARLPKV